MIPGKEYRFVNYVYPAVFYEEEGKISVVFPDLGNLATFGDDMGMPAA
jgi:antitoxin HicB